MLTNEQNDLLTQTGPGTPGGAMMRAYWQPVAMARELESDVPLSVRVMSEELVLFRDAKGAPQLIGRYCPHRLVDLSYGRVEDGGLRCIYHGWLLAGDGRCLDQPGERAPFKDRIRHPAYPCFEAAGLIFAYLGAGAPPRRPAYEFFDLDPVYVWSGKLHHDCNWLQGHEGNVDPQHLSYLHRYMSEAEALDPKGNTLFVADVSPSIEPEETSYGMRIRTVRGAPGGGKYVRITNHMMPNCGSFGGIPAFDPAKGPQPDERGGYQLHWHVPIDDGSHWKYTVLFNRNRALDKDYVTDKLFGEQKTFFSRRTRANHHLQDRGEMRQVSFAGVGRNFFDHDKLATEVQGPGPIIDRSQEHLGTTDRPVMLMRRLLLQAAADVAAGRDPLFVERDGQPDAIAGMAVEAVVEPPPAKEAELEPAE
jgi:phenylpropionate dioxygenase-like ring-hydroxylating dioxygenase large terminal subunit